MHGISVIHDPSVRRVVFGSWALQMEENFMDENQRQDWWPEEHPDDTSQNPELNTPSAENEQTPEPNLQNQSSDIYRSQNNQQNSDSYWNRNDQQNSGNPWNTGNQPNYGYHPQRPAANTMAIASLVMGILSVVLLCCGFSFFFGALGILFALLSRKDSPMESQAKVGLGLSIGGTVVGLLLLIVAFAGNASYYSDFMKEYQRFYNEYEDYNMDDSYPGLEDFGDFQDWYYEAPDSGDSL